jgi:hypothetical protein
LSTRVLSSVLPHLTKLTHLNISEDIYPDSPAISFGEHYNGHLRSRVIVDDALEHLSKLTALRELKVGTPVTIAGLEGLSALRQLTWLMMEKTQHVTFSSSSSSSPGDADGSISSAGFQHLTALQRLQLRVAGSIEAGFLGSFKQLRHLEVTNTPMVDGAAGTAAFLAAVPRLQQLTYLYWYDQGGHAWAPSAEAYSSLTANSKLVELHVSLAGSFGAETPAVFGHVFGVGLRRTNLRTLHLDGGCFSDSFALSRVVECCPELRELHANSWGLFLLPALTQQLDALRELSYLTKLALYPSKGTNSTFAALAQLTQLKDLALQFLAGAQVPPLNLQHLTTLTRLTQLTWVQDGKSARLHNTVSMEPTEFCGRCAMSVALHGSRQLKQVQLPVSLTDRCCPAFCCCRLPRVIPATSGGNCCSTWRTAHGHPAQSLISQPHWDLILKMTSWGPQMQLAVPWPLLLLLVLLLMAMLTCCQSSLFQRQLWTHHQQ